ncbi:hypothetical protein [Thalassospira alkalitolerans]|uniref:hypothetical protein n=1 Tax=Thalassospira alkalitolerans TaxID=1293890 RepID=UPI003AA848D7
MTASKTYNTPHEATRALLDYEHFPGDIWEPFAGNGEMAFVLRDEGYTVTATTLHSGRHEKAFPKHRVTGNQDFFDFTVAPKPNIFSNPPFECANEIVNHAFDLGVIKMALLLNIKFLGGQGRWGFGGRGVALKWSPARVYPFADRVTMYPADWDGETKNSTTETYAWFIWDRSCHGQASTIPAILYSGDYRIPGAAE